jgi:aerobic-type carbon monoxide dehydrogenase small subunit (CoxS/CutS family)
MKLACRVNGEEIAAEVEPRMLLSDFIRHTLRLTGTNVGCEMGVCGACTLSLDGEPVRSCLIFAAQVDGCDIRTVESLAPDGELGRLQRTFHEHHALQCGYCTPGILMTLDTLMRKQRVPRDETAIREMLSGNICRCTGYQNIVDAVLALAE